MGKTKVNAFHQLEGRSYIDGMDIVNIATDYNLDGLSKLKQSIICTSTKKYIILPNCTTLFVGWSVIIKNNESSNIPIGIKNYNGTIISDNLYISNLEKFICTDTSTPAGTWEVYSTFGNYPHYKQYTEEYNYLSNGTGLYDIDVMSAPIHHIQLVSGVTNSINLTNKPSLSTNKALGITIKITQSNPIAPIMWNTSIRWSDGTVPTMDQPNMDYYVSFITHSNSVYWDGFENGKNMAVPI